MVDSGTVEAAGPFIAKLAKGESTDWAMIGQADSRNHVAAWNPKGNAMYGEFEQAPPESVAVFRVSGPLTKYDQECGNPGMLSLMKKMQLADKLNNITAHLMEIDSGGGEATIVDTVAMAIRRLEKPVVAIVNGVAASAAYYLAAAADEIYASEKTDEFGSIGVVLSFADVRPYYIKEGIVFHEIYAKDSTLKNDDWKQALDGNYEPIQKKVLDPYAAAFISRMKEFRSKLHDDGEVFKGQTYLANGAKKIGLIEGIKTWEEAADRAVALGKKKKALGSRDAAAGRITSNKQNSNTMKFQSITATLGYDTELDEDGGLYLQGAELSRLENALAQAQATPASIQEQGSASQPSVIREELEEIGSALTSMTHRLETLTERLEAQAQRIQLLEDHTPGASPTMPLAAADPTEEEKNADPAVKAAAEEFERALRAARR
jgi:ClpP class serine protease